MNLTEMFSLIMADGFAEHHNPSQKSICHKKSLHYYSLAVGSSRPLQQIISTMLHVTHGHHLTSDIRANSSINFHGGMPPGSVGTLGSGSITCRLTSSPPHSEQFWIPPLSKYALIFSSLLHRSCTHTIHLTMCHHIILYLEVTSTRRENLHGAQVAMNAHQFIADSGGSGTSV